MSKFIMGEDGHLTLNPDYKSERESDLLRRNRTRQEREDFNRIKQLEGEIKTLKSLAQLNLEELRRALELSHSLAVDLIKYKEVMKKYDKYSTQSFAKKAGIELWEKR